MAAKKTTGAKKSPPKKKITRKKSPGIKKAGVKQRPRKKGGGVPLGQELKKVGLGIAILLAVCLTAAMLADILFKSGTPVDQLATKTAKVQKAKPAPQEKPGKAPGDALNKSQEKGRDDKTAMGPLVARLPDLEVKKKARGLIEKNPHGFVYEVFDKVGPDHDKPIVTPKPSDDTMPQIAIIIDDIGYDKAVAMGLYHLNPDITFSILPFSPFGKSLAKRLGQRKAELMLHLPMEPVEYPKVNPGQGALLSSMTPDVLLTELRKNINAIPGIVGVNNHMGSKLTSQSDQMNQIFTVLKKKNLFFVDSRTAPKSQGQASARLFQLRFSQRDIFLDNFQEIEYITGQFQRLVKIAKKHGTAVGIGHPYQATLDTLKIELPKLKGKVKVVRASRLVAIPI